MNMKRIVIFLMMLSIGLANLCAQNPESLYETANKDNKRETIINPNAAKKLQIMKSGLVNPTNDVKSVPSKTSQSEPIPLPFFENFDDPNCLTTTWTVVDNNGDNFTWNYNDWSSDADGGIGCLQIMAMYTPADDYLISSPIIFPDAGSYNISFQTNPLETNSLRILYGLTPDFQDMNVLVDYESLSANDWEVLINNLEITQPGNYYFAFHFYTSDRFSGLELDNIHIEAGSVSGAPDIMFNHLILPVSGCGLSAETQVGAKLFNNGTETITEFTLSYEIDGTTVSQEFNETIGINESVEVFFDQTADFSAIGNHLIIVHAETPNEVNTNNNEISSVVRHFEPIVDLPFESDFSNEEDIYYWNPEIDNAWEYIDDFGCYFADDYVPLLSTCVTLTPGVYRLNYTYVAGIEFFGNIYYDDFYIAFGESGTDHNEWEPIKESFDLLTDGEIEEDEVVFTVDEEGNYVFAIIPLSINNLGFFTITLSPVLEHDLKIKEIISPTSLTRLTPYYHAEGEKTFQVAVENKGFSASGDGTIKVLQDGDVISTQDFSFSSAGEIQYVAINVNLLSVLPGELRLNFEAFVEDGPIHSKDVIKMVTDSVFAWDAIDGNFIDGIGSTQEVAFGLIYETVKPDILTSITLGLLEEESNSNLRLSVYEIDDDLNLGSTIFSEEYPRTNGNNNEGTTFDVPNIELSPGKYFFEVGQLDGNNIAIAYDEDPNGFFYDNTDNLGHVLLVDLFGFIHLRPNFGGHGVGIQQTEIADNQLLLYPNPVKGILNIELEKDGIEKLIVYNAIGKTVSSVPDINNDYYQLDTKAFAPGIYFISVHTRTGVIPSKFIVR